MVLPALCAVACTVKEDRDSCPCYLTLDFSHVRQESCSWFVCGREAEVLAGTFEEGSLPAEVCLPVRRGKCVVVVASGEGYVAESGLEISEGNDCPELWMCRDTVDAAGDEALCSVILHKEYALGTIRLLSGTAEPLRYELVGSVCGYYPDGELRHGRFSVKFPPLTGIGELCARVPRQEDNSLRLNVYEASVLVRSFPIGEILYGSGYDWGADDLEDFIIALDYTSGRIALSSDLWTETYYYELAL